MISTLSVICDSAGAIGNMTNGRRPSEQYVDMRTPQLLSGMVSSASMAPLLPADTSYIQLRADWVFCEADSSAQAMVQFFDRSAAPIGGPMSLSAGSAVKNIGAYSMMVFGVQKTGILTLTYGEGDICRDTGGISYTPTGYLDMIVINANAPGALADTVYTTPVSTLNEQIGFSIDVTNNTGTAFYGVNVTHWDFLRLALAVVENGVIKYTKPLFNCRIASATNSLAPTLYVNPSRINTSDVMVWEYSRTAAGVAAAATFPNMVVNLFGQRPYTRYSNVHGG